MKIGDVVFDDYGALLRVNAEKYRKTRYWQIGIIGNSIADLKAWLGYHLTDWTGLRGCSVAYRKEQAVSSLAKSDVYSILRKTKKRAGITKKIYPHLFRHTRATILASKVAEAPLESQMDWVHGSRTDKDICPSITKGLGQRDPESIWNQSRWRRNNKRRATQRMPKVSRTDSQRCKLLQEVLASFYPGTGNRISGEGKWIDELSGEFKSPRS